MGCGQSSENRQDSNYDPAAAPAVGSEKNQTDLIVEHDDSGPWVKILQYGKEPYKPTSSPHGELTAGRTDHSDFAKLSDKKINQLNKDC